MPVGENHLVRFGPYQLDSQCGQLRKNGFGVKLQGQPVEILEILLEKPGELVTREELHQRLWSTDTFVDFDHSLNTAIKRLRQALGDNADTPKYIETIPKRGYRFIGEVSHDSPGKPIANSAPEVDGSADKSTATLPRTAAVGSPEGRSARRWELLALCMVALLAGVGAIYSATRAPAIPRIVGSHALTKTGFRKGPFSLFAGGGNVYFQENRPDHAALVQVRVSGGEVSEIAVLPDISVLTDISRDGSELLQTTLNRTTNQFDAWIQPLPAGPARLVVKDAWWPVWTADNRGILFARNHHTELFRVNADGADPRRVAAFPDIAQIQVSPEGRRVRVSTNFAITNLGLLQVDATGSSSPESILADAPGDLMLGTWSPNGKLFFFLSWVNDRNDLWVLPEKRHWWQWRNMRPVQLTFGPVSIGPPAISKDGKQIYAAALERHGELAVYDEHSRNFLPYLSGISACYTDFSRDGQWVAYVSYPEGTLWRSRIDGTDRRQLTMPPIGVMNPRWSPDGKLIAFVNVAATASHSVEQKKWQIYTVSADGGGPLLLLEGAMFNDPAWSPDGKSLVYGVGPVGSAHLKILDLQTMQSIAMPGSEGLTSPRWSPDGEYVAALKQADYPAARLMIYSVATRRWKELASGALTWPSWSHDSRYVYAQEPDAVVRVSVATHKKEQAASLRGVHTAVYYFDRISLGWFGLTPDDRPITMRDTGIEEIYAFDLEYK